MKLTLIRLLLFALFYLLFHYAFHVQPDVLWAFATTYVLEPLVAEKT